MKKLIGIGMGLAMMALATVPAMAASNVSIGLTGPFSTNNVWLKNNTKIKVYNNQNAVAVNAVNQTVNIGNNTSSFNTVGGGITTGNATSTTNVTNQLNGAVTQVNGCGCEADNQTATINTTGPFSNNNVFINAGKSTRVENNQNAFVTNLVNSNVNTGGNNSSFNTVSGGSSTTGHADSRLDIGNLLNSSSTYVNVPVVVGP